MKMKPLVSKYVEDIKIKNISLENPHFLFILYDYIIMHGANETQNSRIYSLVFMKIAKKKNDFQASCTDTRQSPSICFNSRTK